MTEPDAPQPRDQLMREAAAWFARMRGPDAEASRPEFEAWLRLGALHRGAYNRAAEIFAMGKLLAEEEKPVKASRQARKLAPMLAGIVAIAAMGGIALHLVPPAGVPDGDRSAPVAGRAEDVQHLASGAETHAVRLSDGSRIVLAPGTLVEARLGASERRFDLIGGQARFEVFHEARPFLVHAGGGLVTARGTIFDVALSPDRRVTVRLIEGEVDVRLPAAEGKSGPGRPARRLRPGDRLSFPTGPLNIGASPDGSERPSRRVAARAPAAAPDLSAQAVEFDGVPVAELVAAANRGSPRPIVITDGEIGERRVSGRFRVDDTALLAERLALLFELSAQSDDPARIVLAPR